MREATVAIPAPADPVRRHAFSRADYHRMAETGILPPDARVELIEGEVVDMAPIGSRHAAVVDRLVEWLRDAVGARAQLRAQSPIVLDDGSEPQPDIALLRRRADFYRSAHPRPEDVLLLIEVADTTPRFDREVKVPMYARAGIGEVWVVDLAAGAIHLYASPDGGAYRELASAPPPTLVSPRFLAGVAVDVAPLFAD